MVVNMENLCEGSKLLVSVLIGFSAAEVPTLLVLQPQRPPVSQTEESGTFLPETLALSVPTAWNSVSQVSQTHLGLYLHFIYSEAAPLTLECRIVSHLLA